jgi:hypothetical protein
LTFTVKLLANPELCSLRYLSASYRRTPVSSATGPSPTSSGFRLAPE